ncbi:cubilin-like protein, partial [Dinothrombium tinctorium]
PKLYVKDGHLIFETATNKNITFKSSSGGSIIVNNENLGTLVNLAKVSLADLKQLTSTHISGIQEKINGLEQQISSLTTTVNNFNVVQQNVTRLSQTIELILGSGSEKLTPLRIRRAVLNIYKWRKDFNRLKRLLSQNECESNPCKNGATCIDTYNSFVCRCPSGWQGPTCEEDVNECALFAGTDLGCQNGATCRNTPGSYQCQCAANWKGIHCTESHDDCDGASNVELCGHGTCYNVARRVPGQPNYRCVCDQGWKTNGVDPACNVDVNECTESRPPCSVNPPVVCINYPGGFQCGPCPPGFTGNGIVCTDIDECAENNGHCSTSPRIQCTNTIGSRICGPCPAGFIGDGTYCTFVGACRSNNGGCSPLATCIESGGDTRCQCPPNYIGNGIGPNGCLPRTGTTCSNNPCVHGTCIPSSDKSQAFTCQCSPGYSGTLCDVDINDCKNNPCKNGGTCIDQQNGFLCVCSSEWQGITCEETREVCGGRFPQPTGYIKYPLSSNSYGNNQNCIWIITTTPGKVLNLIFTAFNLEHSLDCSFDFLQINDGTTADSPKFGKYCGILSELPNNGNLTTNTNEAYIWFKSDQSQASNGFEFSWNTTDPICGGLVEGNFGSIKFPVNGGRYPNGRDCYWLVNVKKSKRIQFHFAMIAIERHSSCDFDYLKIYDGQKESDPILGLFCNSTQPAPLTTSSSSALIHFHSDESSNDLGFHLTFASVPGVIGCGGTLTADRGVIASPNFPDRYDTGLECDWLIRINPKDTMKLIFTEFDLEHHEECKFDYLEVYDGPDESAPLFGRYCSQKTRPPSKIISTGSTLFVKFRSDGSISGKGFSAIYETICGGYFNSPVGEIRSPYFPNPYPSNKRCIYHIAVEPGNVIQLQFTQFDVEGSINCALDSVEIRDGGHENDTRIGNFCGPLLPSLITSSFNELYITFKTDGSIENKGFVANYSTLNIGCGGIYKTSPGVISTPSHVPSASFDPVLGKFTSPCTWLIRSPPEYVIQLNFNTFSLTGQQGRCIDYVEIRDFDNNVFGTYCGTQKPPMIQSMSNLLTIIYLKRSPPSEVAEGFTATFVFKNASTACGGTYTRESGFIRSPNFPADYSGSRSCTWIIKAQEGHKISLDVRTFEIEPGPTCNFDFLEIRNGQYYDSPLVGKFCGTTITKYIVSHSNALYLQFKSDDTVSSKGFEIYYETALTGCGGTVTQPTGSITSPNYPQPYYHNAVCDWLIHVAQGSSITVHLIDVDVETSVDCQLDYLEFFDGSTDKSKLLRKVCQSESNSVLTSSSNQMLVRFRTDASISSRGFRITYNANCTRTIKGYRGAIENPHFPYASFSNVNCTWNIEAPLGNNITISFSHLNISESYNCTHTYVEVFELVKENQEGVSQKSLIKLCNNSAGIPKPFNTSSNVAKVNFFTEASLPSLFRLEWLSIGCGGEFIEKSFGSITSPNYPNPYPRSIECLWRIKVPDGNHVQLNIDEFQLEYHSDCAFDNFRVFSGPDTTSPEIIKLCHKLPQAKVVSSSGHDMTIYFKSDSSVVGRGFRVWFQAVGGECGGYFSTNSGTITSKNYPKRYESKDDCVWHLNIPGLHRIELTFTDFDMPESENCSSSYLAVYDHYISESNLLLKHCGKTIPPVITSSDDFMTIRMKADGHSDGKGFQAKYVAICGGIKTIESGETGALTSSNYPHTSVQKQFCNWTLQAKQPGERVTLTFTRIEGRRGASCVLDYVEVREGDSSDGPVIGRFCANDRLPAPITSEGSALWVSLHSKAVFRAVYTTGVSSCGGQFDSEKGYFMSPGYPNNYPLETECVWTIVASPGNRVTFSFIDFKLEDSEFCNLDYLELREGGASGKFINRYCGNTIPTVNVTSTNVLWVKFRSDNQGSARGFKALYDLQHGVDIVGTSGMIASPRFPESIPTREGKYTWTITSPQNTKISVTFSILEIISPQSGSNCFHYVKILDGYSEDAPELGKFCGFTLPPTIISHSNFLKIVYSSFFPARFFLSWQAVSSFTPSTVSTPLPPTSTKIQCGENILLNVSSKYELESPGYPYGYNQNLNCTWIISTAPGYHISLQVLDMNIEGVNESCYYDKVHFFEPKDYLSSEWRKNKTICGRYTPFYESTSNKLKVVFETDPLYNRTGFKIEFDSVCGGFISESSGIISTELVRGSTSCEWVVKVRQGRTISVTFEEMNIRSSDSSCNSAFILLRNGESKTSPFLGSGRFCGTTKPQNLETSSNFLYIKFFARLEIHASFRLNYREMSLGCGGPIELTLTSKSFELTSPNYPHLPPHDFECDWIVMSPPNTNIRIDFDVHFNQFTCNYTHEYIEIRDGGTITSRLIKKVCVPPRENSLLSTSNMMFIRFVTSGTWDFATFKATVNINKCGGTYRVWGASEITSLNYPQKYEDNLDCQWYFQAPSSRYTIVIRFLHLDLVSYTADCSSGDFIEFRDGNENGEVLGRFCQANSNTTTTINSRGPVVFAQFKSDTSDTATGFKFSVETKYNECGGTINPAITGVISSPNYPNPYPYPRTCQWYLRAPYDRRIKLTFNAYNMKPSRRISGDCVDRLSVTKSPIPPRTYLAQLLPCNNVKPAPIESLNMGMSIDFITNGLDLNEGFQATYSSEDEILLEVPPKSENEGDCNDGVLAIGSGEENRMRSEFIFCGNKTGTNFFYVLKSSGEESWIFLTMNYTNNYRGIKGKYRVQNCGGFYFEQNANLSSPGYPEAYPPNTICEWKFQVPYGSQVTLTFLDFELESNCENDFVEIKNGIYDNSPTIGKYCGKDKPSLIKSGGNGLTVIMRTDSSGVAKGFNFKSEMLTRGCGGVFHDQWHTFTSPNYPRQYDNNVECEWLIEVDPTFHVNISFYGRFEIEKEANCNNDYVRIEEMINDKWVKIGQYCGFTTPDTVTSRSHKVRIKFLTNNAVTGDGFMLTYTLACGDIFTGDQGVITSPGYPSNYLNNLNCRYLIQMQPGDFVSLEFEDFDIEDHETCLFDRVIIYKSNTTNDRTKLGPYCGKGSEKMPPKLINRDAMLIDFKTDTSVKRKGFKAVFKRLSCGGNFTTLSGEIESPSDNDKYLKNMNCIWLITVPENRVIEFTFLSIDIEYCYRCYCDGVTIRDGNNASAPPIGFFCGRSEQPRIKSTGNQLYVRFHTNSYYERKGFKAAYRTTIGEKQGCGGVLESKTGVIQSPDIDKNGLYDYDLDCVWTIIAGENAVITLTFEKFDLEESPANMSKCAFDYLEIRDGISHVDALIDFFCGKVIPNPITSSSNKLFIQFHSDSQTSKSGFKINYTTKNSSCGGLYE